MASKSSSLDPQTDFVIDKSEQTDSSTGLRDLSQSDAVAPGEEYGFYITKNWFAKKWSFPIFPQKGYKPVFLNDLNEGLWYDFNRDVQHYQRYYATTSWYYKLWTIVPTCWFLVMVLPDLLWFYDIVFRGVGIICGMLLALAFCLDLYLQRRLLAIKIQPAYKLLIDTYKTRFLMCGYLIEYKLESTALDGMNSYIQFQRAPVGTIDPPKPPDFYHGAGWYVDEDFLGYQPYVLEMTSRTTAPRYLTGVDSDTWQAFARDLKARSKTPMKYLLGPTIAMGSIVALFSGGLIYSVIVFAGVRHWLLILLFPLYALADVMRSFRRRHYVENVMCFSMKDLLQHYEPYFSKAGYKGSFELEYIMGYLCVNTYFVFKRGGGTYKPYEVSKPLDNSTTTV